MATKWQYDDRSVFSYKLNLAGDLEFLNKVNRLN